MSKASKWTEFFMALVWAHLDVLTEEFPELTNIGPHSPRCWKDLSDRNYAALLLAIAALEGFTEPDEVAP